jgi:hypothetical protein
MQQTIRIALVVAIMAAAVTIMAVAAVSPADHALALGFYSGGDFGYFGFCDPIC